MRPWPFFFIIPCVRVLAKFVPGKGKGGQCPCTGTGLPFLMFMFALWSHVDAALEKACTRLGSGQAESNPIRNEISWTETARIYNIYAHRPRSLVPWKFNPRVSIVSLTETNPIRMRSADENCKDVNTDSQKSRYQQSEWDRIRWRDKCTDVQTDTGGNLVPASQVPRLTWIPKLGLRTFFEVIRGNRRNLLIISSSGSVFWGLKPETKTPIGMGAKMCKQTQVPGDWHGLGQEYPKEYLRQVSCMWPKKLFSVNWYFCRKNLC